MPEVVVYGAGVMGREVAETILANADCGRDLTLVGFLDDAREKQGKHVLGYPVLGPGEWIADHPECQIVLGFGHPWARYHAAQMVEAVGGTWATVIHPQAVISPSARVDVGCVVFAGCIVSAGAHLKKLTYVNYHTVLSHDAVVGPYACVMAQVALAGCVRVGEGAFVGTGVSTRQGVTIGEWSIVGAGATVVRDVPPFCTAIGVPAQPHRYYSSPQEMPAF